MKALLVFADGRTFLAEGGLVDWWLYRDEDGDRYFKAADPARVGGDHLDVYVERSLEEFREGGPALVVDEEEAG